MRQMKGTGLQRWWYRRKLDVLYYCSSLQLALFNAYLSLRYAMKHHHRPERGSKAEAEIIMKKLLAEHNEQRRL